MNFNSVAFLIYLPIVVVLYWLCPSKFRWLWLLLCSYFFYMFYSPSLIVLILFTTFISYLCSILIEKYPKYKKVYLVITLVICLGTLFAFKYTQFFLDSLIGIVNVFGGNLSSIDLNIILPVGISFYTFQTLSYVIDVYREKFPAEHHFGYYALFVSFFPQLVAGPIEKPGDLIPQLEQEHHFSIDDLLSGSRFLLLGFFRKVVIADVIGIYVNSIFADLASANALTIFVGGLLFCFEMYGDFAGYSEIAMGSARLLGIRLTQNFNQPYLSKSYGEFFHRWHITLNRWFTEYLYIPLGGNKKGKIRKIINVLIVFSLCGLWHGAKWTYVIWGLYAAFWICLESLFLDKILNALKRNGINTNSSGFILIRRIVMMFIFVIAAICFRADNIADLGVALARLFTIFETPGTALSHLLSTSGLSLMSIVGILLSLILMKSLYPFAYLPPRDLSTLSKTQKCSYLAYRFGIYILLTISIAFCWIMLASNHEISSFAYFQF